MKKKDQVNESLDSVVEKADELSGPAAPKEFVSLSEQANFIFSKNLNKMMSGYDKSIELVWEGDSRSGTYKGRELAIDFWKKFFMGRKFVSMDAREFKTEGNSAECHMIFSLKDAQGKTVNYDKVYSIELGNNGKIIKETWKNK